MSYILILILIPVLVHGIDIQNQNQNQNSNKHDNEYIVSSLTVKSISKECLFKPIFLTIAKVNTPLYWNLIENFFYTMKKFGHDECAALICIDGKFLVVLGGIGGD